MSKKNTTPISAGQWAKALVHSAPRSGWLVGIIAVLIAFALGAILIVITGASVGNAYTAMFKGSIFNASALNRGLSYALRPMVDSIFFAIPLILAGLGLGFGFRAGLFNIGGAGQIIFGALAAIWVSFSLDLPYGLHLLVALIAAAAAGGFYAGIAGYLKAKTGANEVIVTIMLNSVATLALTYVLSLDSWHQPGQNNPVTPVAQDTAALPALLPAPFKLHLGFIIAVVAVFVYWWILERSTFGFEVRAVGANPHAARTAGMSIAKVTTLTMVTSGIFAGIAGANEALGTMYQAHQGVTSGIAGTVGFDAITVALLAVTSQWESSSQVCSSAHSRQAATPCRLRVCQSIWCLFLNPLSSSSSQLLHLFGGCSTFQSQMARVCVNTQPRSARLKPSQLPRRKSVRTPSSAKKALPQMSMLQQERRRRHDSESSF